MSEHKRALVVDDSKSARLVLRRMLEKHDLDVDTVESGDKALEFLRYHQPDIIFLDHMMPGKDGFETLKALKRNPRTTTIAVMMYTSKGGDLYRDEARELGAVGVLPKTVAPGELFETLKKMGLVQERRREERPLDEDGASERADDIRKRPAPVTPFTELGMSASTPGTADNIPDAHLRGLLEEQRVEIRKDVLLGMETVARQTTAKLNKTLDELHAAETQQATAGGGGSLQLPVTLLAVGLLLSLALNFFLFQQRESAMHDTGLAASVDTPAPDTAANAVAEAENLALETGIRLEESWQTAAWAMNQKLTYGHDEIALDDPRTAIIETLLARLQNAGFAGKVTLQTHAGVFCLLGDQESGFRLPPPELPLDQCNFIGNPVQAADTPAAHQSLKFANFLTSTPLLADGSIELDVVTLPRDDLLAVYPERSSATAQTWNQAALANNRILVQLEPRL